ncbi:Short-chain dehydrogenase [Nocardioides scoriae]|uniref:Short-chain dehydrogenase n=1 Tax=Nocardioides scoriae TaxID=642780 RepID=A0A1H1XWC7_9ACTN|nr:SDR family oxidoreductase [Nocardioides scoriae]SDT13435.1 Short-chain dehydrogenase [Nocardioides scoriae]
MKAAEDRRTHLVTGAGSGIGGAVARVLLERGDELVLLARDASRAEDLATDFPGARTLVADLADVASLATLDLTGPLDSVVHAAGVVELGPVGHLSAGAWRSQLDVNLLAPAELTRVALPALRAARGTVVFVNSGAGLRANPDWAAYAASKFGLRALADALRQEEAAHGVRVTTVYPGRTATPMQEQVHAQEGRDYDPSAWIQPATVAAAVVHALDLPADATIPDVTVSPGPAASG